MEAGIPDDSTVLAKIVEVEFAQVFCFHGHRFPTPKKTAPNSLTCMFEDKFISYYENMQRICFFSTMRFNRACSLFKTCHANPTNNMSKLRYVSNLGTPKPPLFSEAETHHHVKNSFQKHYWLVVSTHLKNISQNGNLPQIGVKIKHV